MSIEALAWAWDQDQLPTTEKIVLLAIANCVHPEGVEAFPGQRYLSAKTGASIRSVRRAIAALEKRGLIRRHRRSRDNGTRTSDLIVVRLAAKVASSRKRQEATVSETSGHCGRAIKLKRKRSYQDRYIGGRRVRDDDKASTATGRRRPARTRIPGHDLPRARVDQDHEEEEARLDSSAVPKSLWLVASDVDEIPFA